MYAKSCMCRDDVLLGQLNTKKTISCLPPQYQYVCYCCPLISDHLITCKIYIFFPFIKIQMMNDILSLSLSPANQPHSKVCMHSYLFPFPVSHQTHNATEYDSAISKCLWRSYLFTLWKYNWLTSLLSSLQRLLEYLHAHRCRSCSARWVRHHLRCSVLQPLLV